MINQWADKKPEEEIKDKVTRKETERIQEKLKRYNVHEIGHMEEERAEDRRRFLCCQMNNALTK